MIPAPILAEAREAFRETLNLRGELFTGAQAEAWEEAEAVLSRHWPADAAGRSSDMTEDQWTRFREHLSKRGWLAPAESDNMRDIRDAFRAALSTPAPAESVRIVRIMVAVDAKNDKLRTTDVFDGDDEEAWDHLASLGYPIRLCIAEIPVPIREVPVVQASVRGAGT